MLQKHLLGKRYPQNLISLYCLCVFLANIRKVPPWKILKPLDFSKFSLKIRSDYKLSILLLHLSTVFFIFNLNLLIFLILQFCVSLLFCSVYISLSGILLATATPKLLCYSIWIGFLCNCDFTLHFTLLCFVFVLSLPFL